MHRWALLWARPVFQSIVAVVTRQCAPSPTNRQAVDLSHTDGGVAPPLPAPERRSWTLAETNSTASPVKNILALAGNYRVIPVLDGVATPQACLVHPPASSPLSRTPSAGILPVCIPTGLIHNEAIETSCRLSPVRLAVVSRAYPVQLVSRPLFRAPQVRLPRFQNHPRRTLQDVILRCRTPPGCTSDW